MPQDVQQIIAVWMGKGLRELKGKLKEIVMQIYILKQIFS
jgi:hypothetical protein